MGPCVRWPIFHRALVALALMLAAGRLDFAWADEALVVDLSDSEVEITADFNGSSVLMFGALDMPGDVIVVVRGPLQRQIVATEKPGQRHLAEHLGGDLRQCAGVLRGRRQSPPGRHRRIRTARTRGNWVGIPAFWPGTGKRHYGRRGIGRVSPRLDSQQAPRRSLSGGPLSVKILGDKLFRTEIWFPANVATGAYRLLCTWSTRGGWWPKNR